ncbi:MAG: hypothetical protein GKC10_02875 [Methanosarcinales archaeon]|nr:hypothetical protein [Methanosarcinales archaeon]
MIDSRCSKKEFEFDQVLLMPTARGYRALVEQARIEMDPELFNYLSNKWSAGALENLSYFVMAAAVYARSISNPPYTIDIGKVLLRTLASCNIRCRYRKETGGGCILAMNRQRHHLPKCIKIPKDIYIIWSCIKRYVGTGRAVSAQEAVSLHDAMRVEVDLGPDFYPSTSC